MKKICKIIFLLIFNSVLLIFAVSTPLDNCFSQITFQKTFGGASLDEGNAIQQTTDGGYIIAGVTQSAITGNYDDFYLIKTAPNGDTLWTKILGGTGTDRSYSVQQTTDGGYIVAGNTYSFGSGVSDVYLIRTLPNGAPLWSKTFGETGYDYAYCVKQTTDGGYIITGIFDSFGADNGDVYLIKTDVNGDSLWTKTFGETGNDVGYSVQQTTDGGYIITGYTFSFGAGDNDVYLIKTSPNGSLIWTKTFGGTNDDKGYSVQQTTDGGYIIIAYTQSFGAGYDDIYLIKTDPNGDALWTKTFGGTDSDAGSSVQQTTDGGYIIAGRTTSFGAGNSDVYLIKTDPNGDILWSKTFGGTSYDGSYSIQQTTDGGYIITGYTQSFMAGNFHVYLIKTDSMGNSGCNEGNPASIVTTPATQITSPATMVGSTNTIVTAPATLVGSWGPITTLCTTVGIPNFQFPPSSEGTNFQFAPNPLTTQSKLTFKNRNKEKFLFTLYEITGRITETISTISSEIILTKGSKQQGVYLFNLKNTASSEIINGKIIVR